MKDNFIVVLLMIVLSLTALSRSDAGTGRESMKQIAHLKDFDVIEFRRYTIKEGERINFARYFESFFPEAFEQLGAIAFGQFYERKNPSCFTWIRGFKNMDARATINASFYYGPLWREHSLKMNERMIDSDNVLLLRPLGPDRRIAVLPAVDPVTEPTGAHGVVVAHIFAVQKDRVDEFAQQAEATFARYRSAGAREAGVLVTLDAQNNFPQLPIRTDGPYLVWLGIIEDNSKLETVLNPLVQQTASSFAASGLLRSAPEWIVLDPTPRSRLRWISEAIR